MKEYIPKTYQNSPNHPTFCPKMHLCAKPWPPLSKKWA